MAKVTKATREIVDVDKEIEKVTSAKKKEKSEKKDGKKNPSKKQNTKKVEKKEKGGILKFFKEVKKEMSKVQWPSRKDMVKYSIATISFIIFFAIFFYIIEIIMALLKAKVSDDVFAAIQGDRKGKGSLLMESYNERARKRQAFEADLSQYKGAQRTAVERAIKSGVLNNTNRSHEFVDILSKIEADKGITFDYTNNAKLKESGFAIKDKTVNGFEKDGTVTLNIESAKSWQSVVGHELTHVLEGTDSYQALRETLFKYAESKGELETRKTALTELYKGLDADIDGELTADLVGDYLFGDRDFINRLTGNENLFKKIYNEVKYLCKVATGREQTEIEKVKREFDKAWEAYGSGIENGINAEAQNMLNMRVGVDGEVK